VVHAQQGVVAKQQGGWGMALAGHDYDALTKTFYFYKTFFTFLYLPSAQINLLPLSFISNV
jgi:hypothetical protein